MHLAIFDVAHALVVADGQRQERGDHRAAVDDVAVEQGDGIGDLHDLLRFVDLIDESVDGAGEIVGRGHLDIGAGRGFRREMRGRLEIGSEARLGLHDIGDKHMLAGCDQVGFPELEIGVAIRLVHFRFPALGPALERGFLLRGRKSALRFKDATESLFGKSAAETADIRLRPPIFWQRPGRASRWRITSPFRSSA